MWLHIGEKFVLKDFKLDVTIAARAANRIEMSQGWTATLACRTEILNYIFPV